MKRLLTLLLASVVMITSCEGLLDKVTQQDIVGTWDFFIWEENDYGTVTISESGDCTVCFIGSGGLHFEPQNYIYENGVVKVTNGKVVVDVPEWPSGTFDIRASKRVANRYLIDPMKSGFSSILLGHDICSNPSEFMFGGGGW